MTIEELYELIKSDESYRIERTVSTGNMDKFQEAICAFANDLPGSRKKGYLLIGVHDDGSISGLKVDDTLMKKISGIRSDGNILPLPVMNTEKVETPQDGLYGQARPENFPLVNDYRNNVVAEMVRDDEKSYEESVHSVCLNATCAQLKASLNADEKLLIISMSDSIIPLSEIKLKPLLKPLYGEKSNTLLKDKVIYPLIKLGLVAQTHPETPRHPRQKYYLTELGKAMLEYTKVTGTGTSDSQE